MSRAVDHVQRQGVRLLLEKEVSTILGKNLAHRVKSATKSLRLSQNLLFALTTLTYVQYKYISTFTQLQ